jgi:DNA replication and repair protein RecF
MTTVGPQRDDVRLTLDGMPARTHASQGEQRSVALALRLAGHRLVAERTGTSPVVLLDDVFSELDRERAEALVSLVPEAQVVVTAAAAVPDGVRFDAVMDLAVGSAGVGR